LLPLPFVLWMTLGFALLVAGAAAAARLLALAAAPSEADVAAADEARLAERVHTFLRAHPGPVELRPLALWRAVVTLRQPTVEAVLAAAGEDGAELWQLAPDGVGHLYLPPRRVSPPPADREPRARPSRSRRVC
jgi:hypothetical protein